MTYEPHYCAACDVECGYGLGPPARPVLTWFCRDHIPAGHFGVPAQPEQRQAPAAEGDLFGRVA